MRKILSLSQIHNNIAIFKTEFLSNIFAFLIL